MAIASYASAQIDFNSVSTTCSATDGTMCTYVLNYNTTTWTAAANGPLNNFTCNLPGAGDVALSNPLASHAFMASTDTNTAFDSRCDCLYITWNINGTAIRFNNTNADAVYNPCDYCGTATGNTACELDEDECYEDGVCNALSGVCERESKCVASNGCFTNTCVDPAVGCSGNVAKCSDKTATCEKASCSLVDFSCSWVYDPSHFDGVCGASTTQSDVEVYTVGGELTTRTIDSIDADDDDDSSSTDDNDDDDSVTVVDTPTGKVVIQYGPKHHHERNTAEIVVLMVAPPVSAVVLVSSILFCLLASPKWRV
jgi:hypothetical protein